MFTIRLALCSHLRKLNDLFHYCNYCEICSRLDSVLYKRNVKSLNINNDYAFILLDSTQCLMRLTNTYGMSIYSHLEILQSAQQIPINN